MAAKRNSGVLPANSPVNGAAEFAIETIRISELRPHPRNYRIHPPEQMAHIKRSIEEHGLYRNIVIARDNTILAGHGVVRACIEMERERVPVVRLPIDSDSPAALKVVAGDNEISHLAEVDDRIFAGILKDIKELDDLLGTGYDEMMLANLQYVTRPPHEIAEKDDAAEWDEAGLPNNTEGSVPLRLIVNFRTESDRARFVEAGQLSIMKREAATWSTWWPMREREDPASLKLEPVPATTL